MRNIVAVAVLVVLSAGTALAASPFDGQYHGTITLLTATGAHRQGVCPTQTPFNPRIVDGSFMFRWGQTEVPTKVGPDGGFSAANGNVMLKGKIVGNSLDGSLTGLLCTFNVTAKKA
jgi:hypothetical protein